MKILDYNQTEGFSGHEQIVFLEEEEGSGLTGFIAIHSTVRGPVLGGTRLLRYPNSE